MIALWRQVFGYETAHNDPALAIDKKVAVKDCLFHVAAEQSAIVGTIMAGYAMVTEGGSTPSLFILSVAAQG